MKATDLLRKQHKEVSRLFRQLADAPDEDQGALFDEIAHRLVAHDGVEREMFYPAIQKAMGMGDTLGHSIVEHGVIEFSLYEADEAIGSEDFTYKWEVLKDMVQHHVDEEEAELIPEVDDMIDEETLETLGTRMEARFEEIKASNYRRPLHANLKKMLAGALKPGE